MSTSVRRRIGGEVRDCPLIRIEGEEYRQCDEESRGGKFRGNSNPGEYGQGVLSTKADPFRTVRMYNLGKVAVSRFLGTDPALGYREKFGDDNFLKFRDMVLKPTCTYTDYGCFLIRYTNDQGKPIPLFADLYVYAHRHSEDRDAGEASVVIVGYCTKEEVKAKATIAKARKGRKHLNYNVWTGITHPIAELL